MKRRKGFIELDDYRYIVAKELPLSFAAESVHKTLINLEYVNVDKTLKVIQVSSTLMGEGKSTLLINLAYVLKQRGKKVLTVDLDLRRPKIHRIFDVANEHGLTDYLAGKITREQLIRVDVTGIHYVLSGEKTVAVTNILEATKLKEFF
jgi:Mrp family chromosome partitioning ATPase